MIEREETITIEVTATFRVGTSHPLSVTTKVKSRPDQPAESFCTEITDACRQVRDALVEAVR